MKRATRLIHDGHTIDEATGALSPTISNATTFRQKSVDAFGKWDYSRSGNPTRHGLEETIAAMEEGTRGFAFASGMSAICTTLLLFSPGDHLVVCDDVYGGAFRALTKVFARLGIATTFADATDLSALATAIRPETKALYVETPSNPLLKIVDLRGAASLARERGILSIVDNTFMTPYLQRPIPLGFDIVLHSGTKFLNGHSDVLCGFAVTNDEALGKELGFLQNAFGAVLSPSDCWLVHRGLKTLRVRLEAEQAGAILLAERLAAHPHVTRVHYPGLFFHPGAVLHASQSDGPGAVLSFLTDTVERAQGLLKKAELMSFAVSLGGVESILSYPAMMSHASMPAEERAARGIGENLLRLSVGLEDPDDLWAELAEGLSG